MWMPLQGLSPSMENTQEADVASEVLGVGGNFEQCLLACLEEEPEEDPLVLPHQRYQRVRHAEDQMVVVHGQQLSLPSPQPFVTGTGLAFRAVTIAAGIVGDSLVS